MGSGHGWERGHVFGVALSHMYMYVLMIRILSCVCVSPHQISLSFSTTGAATPLQFNTMDGDVDRRSHTGQYEVISGVPRYIVYLCEGKDATRILILQIYEAQVPNCTIYIILRYELCCR